MTGERLIEAGDKRQDPEPYRYDADKNLRVIAKAVTFRDVCSAIFDQLRPYYATDRNAAIQMMQTISTVRNSTTNDERRELLIEHADHLLTSAKMVPLSEHDIAQLRDADRRESSKESDDDTEQHESESTNR